MAHRYRCSLATSRGAQNDDTSSRGFNESILGDILSGYRVMPAAAKSDTSLFKCGPGSTSGYRSTGSL